MIDIICPYCHQRTSHIDVLLVHLEKQHKKDIEKEKKELEKQNVDELIKKHLEDPLNVQALNQLLHQPNPMGNIQFDELMEELERLKTECKGVRRINTKIKRSFPAQNTTNNDIVIDIDIDDKCDPTAMSKVVQNIYKKINNQTINGIPANTKINNINGNQMTQVDPNIFNDPNNPFSKIFGNAFAGMFGNGSNVLNNGEVQVYSENNNTNTKPNISEIKSKCDKNDKPKKNTKQEKTPPPPVLESESEHDSDAENYGKPSKKYQKYAEEELEETHYGEFLFENTEHCPDTNIHCKELYEAFFKWYTENFPQLRMPSKNEFVKNIKDFHTVYNSVKSNGKFASGLKNLKLKNK
jgi:hypothetical protein